MAYLRKYMVFAATLVAALAVGFVLQQSAGADHPAMAGLSPDAVRQADRQAFQLQTLPPEAVTPLSADVDPLIALPPSRVVPETAAPEVALSDADAPATVPDADVLLPALLPVAPEPPQEPAQELARLDALPTPPVDEPVVIEFAMPAAPAQAATDLPPVPAPAPTPAPTPAPAPAVAAPAVPVPSCDRDLALGTSAPAMLNLTLAADCDVEGQVTVRHAGLVVTQQLSVYGALDIALPAFDASGAVEVVFPDGEVLRAAVDVPDLHRYQRVGVQWQAPDSFQLHAYEQGAGMNEAGHVWAATPREAAHAVRGSGGFLQLLGDSRADWPLLAEVYTFPADRLSATAKVRIEIEAMITEEVCGREMLAETLELRGDGAVSVRELFIEMPDCDTVGGYIVLQNILDDLKVAGNGP